MPQNDLQKAYEAVERDVVSLTHLVTDLKVHIATLNAAALMANQPTINFQIFAPDLSGIAEALFDQLTNIDAFPDEEHPQKLDTAVFRKDLVEKAVAGISAMAEISHTMSFRSGWWRDPGTGEDLRENPFIVPTKIALMHSELSEALEADRKDLMDSHLPDRKGVDVEFADLLHRVFDLAGAMGYDLAGAYIEKGQFNLERADHKLENRATQNGKKY